MNVGDVKTRVKNTFGDESGVQVTDGSIVRWINDAQRDIANQNEGVLEAIGTTDSIQGTQDYALPSNLLVLRSVSYKGSSDRSFRSLAGLSMQQFDLYIDGWDGTAFAQGQPLVYCVFNNILKLFPIPVESLVGSIKLYYQRLPNYVALDADPLDLPQPYHNAVVNYCLSQAYELDEDWDSAGNKMQQMTADVTANREREKWTHTDYYSTITVLPDDNDFIPGGY